MVTIAEHTEQQPSPSPVVCTVDGSPQVRDSIARAIADCRASGAELALVAVLPTGPTGRAELAERVRLAQNALIEAIATARRAGISFTAGSHCC